MRSLIVRFQHNMLCKAFSAVTLLAAASSVGAAPPSYNDADLPDLDADGAGLGCVVVTATTYATGSATDSTGVRQAAVWTDTGSGWSLETLPQFRFNVTDPPLDSWASMMTEGGVSGNLVAFGISMVTGGVDTTARAVHWERAPADTAWPDATELARAGGYVNRGLTSVDRDGPGAGDAVRITGWGEHFSSGRNRPRLWHGAAPPYTVAALPTGGSTIVGRAHDSIQRGGAYIACGHLGADSVADDELPKLWTSTDSGVSWVTTTPPLPVGATQGELHGFLHGSTIPATEMTLVGWSESGSGDIDPTLWHTTDTGATWSTTTLAKLVGFGNASAEKIVSRDGDIVIVGRSWDGLGGEVPTLWEWDGALSTPHDVNDLLVDASPPVMATAADIVVDGTNSIIVGSGDTPQQAFVLTEPTGGTTNAPSVTATAASDVTVAPNPFTRNTTISFEVIRAAPVRVTIHDSLGRRVATLLEETLPAGNQSVDWSGRDYLGKAVVPGIYHIRVESGDRIRSGKIVHLK